MNAQSKNPPKLQKYFQSHALLLRRNLDDDCIISKFIYVIIKMITFSRHSMAKEQYINRILGSCVISCNSNMAFQSLMGQ